MVRLTQTMHLSCVKISTMPKQAGLSLETRHLGLPSGASKMISKPMARLAQTVHLYCADTNTVSKRERSEIPLDPHHIGLPLGASKMIYEPMVRLGQTMNLFALRLILSPNGKKWDSTWQRHLGVPSGASKTIFEPMVRLTQTVHLSYIKISTISKRTKMSFHLSPVPRSIISCIKNDFWAHGTFTANRAPILP